MKLSLCNFGLFCLLAIPYLNKQPLVIKQLPCGQRVFLSELIDMQCPLVFGEIKTTFSRLNVLAQQSINSRC